jgi:transcriptional regulator with XRE-family HTH domain
MSTELHQVDTPPVRADRPNALSDPQDVVRYFRNALGLTEAELTQALGADERSIRRWTSDTKAAAPQRRHAQRIDDLRDLTELLGETLLDEHIARWLRVRNRMLKGARPLDLLSEGDYKRVRDAAEAFIDGDPI